MSEKTKAQRLATKAGAIDELSLQNAIRYRHKQDWPDTILQLTKRIAAVNQTWNKVMWQIMNIPGLSVTYKGVGDKLIVTVAYKSPDIYKNEQEVEIHEITIGELRTAGQYIEVLIMDKLDHSELIARVEAQIARVEAQMERSQ